MLENKNIVNRIINYLDLKSIFNLTLINKTYYFQIMPIFSQRKKYLVFDSRPITLQDIVSDGIIEFFFINEFDFNSGNISFASIKWKYENYTIFNNKNFGDKYFLDFVPNYDSIIKCPINITNFSDWGFVSYLIKSGNRKKVKSLECDENSNIVGKLNVDKNFIFDLIEKQDLNIWNKVPTKESLYYWCSK